MQGLNSIKLKRGICMLETNKQNFSEQKKSHIDLKIENKRNVIREDIEDNAIRIISVQSKVLKVHAEKVKENLHYALKEANDEKMPQEEEKGKLLDFQERMDKIILKPSTLKSSTSLNMKPLRE